MSCPSPFRYLTALCQHSPCRRGVYILRLCTRSYRGGEAPPIDSDRDAPYPARARCAERGAGQAARERRRSALRRAAVSPLHSVSFAGGSWAAPARAEHHTSDTARQSALGSCHSSTRCRSPTGHHCSAAGLEERPEFGRRRRVASRGLFTHNCSLLSGGISSPIKPATASRPSASCRASLARLWSWAWMRSAAMVAAGSARTRQARPMRSWSGRSSRMVSWTVGVSARAHRAGGTGGGLCGVGGCSGMGGKSRAASLASRRGPDVLVARSARVERVMG